MTTQATLAAGSRGSAAATWFSANESKAWAEKFFLLYSPVWMLEMGVVMGSGAAKGWGDAGFLAHALLVAAPLVLVPALIGRERARGQRWYETYWFKANLWIGVFGFVGNYFLSEYFFDVLGMVYRYPSIHLNLDSTLVGTGGQRVPIVMYLFTQAYFMTYHTTAVIVLRRIRTSGGLPTAGLGLPLRAATVVLIAYFWAWAETRAMANPWIADQFAYRDLARMLRYGSIFYACYFVVSFPMFSRLDERPGENWSLRRTCVEALAAGMLVFFLLDLWAKIIGPL